MKKAIIIGNWKMNGTIAFAKTFSTALKNKNLNTNCTIVLCPPATTLYALGLELQNSSIQLGAQNVHFAEKGAYTGELACDMLNECGVKYVILGHSERRKYFNESNVDIAKKVKSCLDAKLVPVVCIGESLQDKEQGRTESHLKKEVEECLQGVTNLQNTILAYEPLWAIGTGKTPTAQEANNTIAFIRKTVANIYGKEVAEKMPILYGGSVNTKNAKEFLSMPEIDGALIGGVSLIVDEFAEIIESC